MHPGVCLDNQSNSEREREREREFDQKVKKTKLNTFERIYNDIYYATYWILFSFEKWNFLLVVVWTHKHQKFCPNKSIK